MIDKQEIYELRAILQAQRNIIANIDQSVSDISVSLNKVDNQSKEISELEKMLDEIELDSDFLSAFDLDNWNDKEIEVLYQEREKKITSEIVTLNYHNWSQFVRDSHAYCLGHNLDASMPWETMLTEENITQIRSENYNNQYLWDMKMINLMREGKSRQLIDLLPDFTEQTMAETEAGCLTWLISDLGFPDYEAVVHAYGTVIGTGNAIVGWDPRQAKV